MRRAFAGSGSMRLSIRMAVLAFGGLAVAASTWLALGEPVRAQTAKTIAEATLEEPNQKTPEVSTDELRGILANRSAVVFDARPPKEYAISHIPRAINVNGKAGRPMSQYTPDASEIIHALRGNKTMAV